MGNAATGYRYNFDDAVLHEGHHCDWYLLQPCFGPVGRKLGAILANGSMFDLVTSSFHLYPICALGHVISLRI